MAQRYVACTCEPQTTEKPRGIIVSPHLTEYLEFGAVRFTSIWTRISSTVQIHSSGSQPMLLCCGASIPHLAEHSRSPQPHQPCQCLLWAPGLQLGSSIESHNTITLRAACWPPDPQLQLPYQGSSVGCESYISHDFAQDFHVHYINCTKAVWTA